MWRLGDDAVRVVAGAGGVAVDEDVGSRLGLDGDGGSDGEEGVHCGEEGWWW